MRPRTFEEKDVSPKNSPEALFSPSLFRSVFATFASERERDPSQPWTRRRRGGERLAVLPFGYEPPCSHSRSCVAGSILQHYRIGTSVSPLLPPKKGGIGGRGRGGGGKKTQSGWCETRGDAFALRRTRLGERRHDDRVGK